MLLFRAACPQQGIPFIGGKGRQPVLIYLIKNFIQPLLGHFANAPEWLLIVIGGGVVPYKVIGVYTLGGRMEHVGELEGQPVEPGAPVLSFLPLVHIEPAGQSAACQ